MAKFIVLEGLDGSGKTTQINLLKNYLEGMNKKVRVIDFPDYKSDGSMLVRMYLGGQFGNDPAATNAYAASMFFAADRYVSYITDWREDYLRGDTYIIANRYTTANAYHQLSKMPEDEWGNFLDWLWDFEFDKLGLPRPDRVILLDMPESVSSALVKHRSETTGRTLDIHEKDGEYLARCRAAASFVSKVCRWNVIRCSDEGAAAPYPVEKIAADVISAVHDLL